MSNSEYAEDHDTTVWDILDDNLDRVAAVELLMEYFMQQDKRVVINELAEWVYDDKKCNIVDFKAWDLRW